MAEILWEYRDFTLPILLLACGIYFFFVTPKNDASTFGIRTKTSKMSDSAWKYEHYLCARIWTYGSIALMVIFALMRIIGIEMEDMGLFNTAIAICFMLASIPVMDKMVQKKYGRPRADIVARWQRMNDRHNTLFGTGEPQRQGQPFESEKEDK